MGKEEKKSLTIKEYPLKERPYEKLDYNGAECLTDAELLAIIIKTGTRNKTAVEVAMDILTRNGEDSLSNIKNMSIEELTKINGVGKVKAIQLKAVSEIAKRLSGSSDNIKIPIKSADDIVKLLMPQMQEYCKEVVKVVFLNTRNCIIRISDISIGSLSASIIHPREIFREAVRYSAASIIICHNHPSGDPSPSKDDIETTRRLIDAGILIGIKVLDHIVFGRERHQSILNLIVEN